MLSYEERQFRRDVGDNKFYKLKKLGIKKEDYDKYRNEEHILSKYGKALYKEFLVSSLKFEDFVLYCEMKPKLDKAELKENKLLEIKKMKEERLEQKLLNKKIKSDKDKIRYRTYRFIERHCPIEKNCQICGKPNSEIHHPNYNKYLEINILCQKHHTKLHNFMLNAPPIILLEKQM